MPIANIWCSGLCPSMQRGVMCAGSKSGLALCKRCLCQIRLSPVIIAVASRTFRRLIVKVLPLSLRQPGCPVRNCCNYYSALVRRPSQWNESCIFQSQVYSYIEDVIKCFNKFQQGWVSHCKTMQNVRINTVTAPTSAHLSPVYLYLWRHLNTAVHWAASATDDTSRAHFSCLSDHSRWPLKGCDGAWSDVSVWSGRCFVHLLWSVVSWTVKS